MLNRKASSIVPVVFALIVGVPGLGTDSWAQQNARPAVSAAPILNDQSTANQPKAGDRKIVYKVEPDGRVIATIPANVPDDPSFARFRNWMTKYLAASADEKTALQAKSVELAKERREAMVKLIPRDPKRALELAVTPVERKALPPAVVEFLEEWVSGRGEFTVRISRAAQRVATATATVPGAQSTPEVAHSRVTRTLIINGRAYSAYVYGQRSRLATKYNLPVYGIALDGLLALHESPMRVLAKGEALPADAKPSKDGTKCPICGKDASNGIVGLVGSTIYYFDAEEDLQAFTRRLWDAERVPGPKEHG